MKDSENIQNFDLSVLSLRELVDLYTNVSSFLRFLEDSRIENEAKGEEQNG